MGIQIAEIIPRKEIELSDLKGKIIAIDAFNTIYQFLTTIRQPDGTPLMDKQGRVTSHLSGLFYRNINLILEGIKPVYVFDGKPPSLKNEEIQRRTEAKEAAREKYLEAKQKEDFEGMRKYSAQFTKITDDVIRESKQLLEAMGIPVVQAIGEGEAEAAFLSRSNLAWASASQDYDSLLYGAKYLIRNLTLARKRKTSSGAYIDINIELIEFDALLNHLQINKDQLICLGILVGTDYNPGGIKGIGQKTALEIVRKYQYPIAIFDHINTHPKYEMDFDWQEIYEIFHKPDCCSTKAEFNFKKPDKARIKQILIEHDFSEERIDSGLAKLEGESEKQKQKKLF